MPSSTPGMKNGSHSAASSRHPPRQQRQHDNQRRRQRGISRRMDDSGWPAARAGQEFAPRLAVAGQLPERHAERKNRQHKGRRRRRSNASPRPIAAAMPGPPPDWIATTTKCRRRESRAPASSGRQHQRPAQRQRGAVIEGGVEPHPNFRRENLDLQNGRDGEIVQRQHKRQDGAPGPGPSAPAAAAASAGASRPRRSGSASSWAACTRRHAAVTNRNAIGQFSSARIQIVPPSE